MIKNINLDCIYSISILKKNYFVVTHRIWSKENIYDPNNSRIKKLFIGGAENFKLSADYILVTIRSWLSVSFTLFFKKIYAHLSHLHFLNLLRIGKWKPLKSVYKQNYVKIWCSNSINHQISNHIIKYTYIFYWLRYSLEFHVCLVTVKKYR
jgi:hypothetical protein